jgi:alkylation response protein AidB-like acyl-CoA dehydrogenase
MVAEVIARFGTPEQQRRYVPKIASGEYFAGAFALSEPGAGSDAASLRTKAVRHGERFCINGEKMWITSGIKSGVFVVWARTDDTVPQQKGISCFLVEHGTPGLSPGKPEEKMGLMASHTTPLSLVDVEVPATAMLGKEGEGFKLAMTALDGGRISISAQATGIGAAALREARAFAQKPQKNGRPLGDEQWVQFALADMACGVDAAWALASRAAWLKKEKQPFSQEAAMAKVFASEMANRAVRSAAQVCGTDSVLQNSIVSRLVRDCRVTQIYEGTSEIQRVVLSRAILK